MALSTACGCGPRQGGAGQGGHRPAGVALEQMCTATEMHSVHAQKVSEAWGEGLGEERKASHLSSLLTGMKKTWGCFLSIHVFNLFFYATLPSRNSGWQ